jgi:hypothetical protein
VLHPRLVAVVVVAVTAGACGSDETPRPTSSTPAVVPPPRLPAPAIGRDLRASFGVLRRARRAEDRLPRAGRRQLRPDPTVPDERGANPRFSRRIAGRPVWVVPGSGTVCLVYVRRGAAGGGCAPTAVARTGRLLRSIAGEPYGVPRGRRFHYGLVPDGIAHVTLVGRGGGTLGRVRVLDNVWATTLRDGTAAAVRVDGAQLPLA